MERAKIISTVNDQSKDKDHHKTQQAIFQMRLEPYRMKIFDHVTLSTSNHISEPIKSDQKLQELKAKRVQADMLETRVE